MAPDPERAEPGPEPGPTPSAQRALEALVAARTRELAEANAQLQREDRRLRAMLSLSQNASAHSAQALLQAGVDQLARLSGCGQAWLQAVAQPPNTAAVQASHPDLPPGATAPDGPQAELLARLVAQAQQTGQPARGQGALALPVIDQHQVRLVLAVATPPQPLGPGDERELALVGADLWRIIRRRHTELALDAAQHAADAAHRAKDTFLANISHEVRTPLNAIVGFAHLLQQDPLTRRQQDHLGKITEAGKHLLQVIDDILDFSRMAARQPAPHAQPLVLRPLLEQLLAGLTEPARAKGIALALVVEPGPAQVQADRQMLVQVLRQLLGNALKFTPQGRITLRLRWLSAAAQPAPAGPGWPAPNLRIEVEDTGIGLTPTQTAGLFEAFAQADSSTTRRFGGTGLGLAISQRLAGLMHGRIGVRSSPGQGSLFWLDLPVLPLAEAMPAAEQADGRVAELQGAHVLVAEDNPINQEVASDLLQAMGLRVTVADDGEAAVRLAAVHSFDLILMDMQMPRLNGLQATARIRATAAGAQVPIVAMTANAFDSDRAACLAAGMNDFLAKPVAPDRLQRCLLQWLRGHRGLTAAGAPTPPTPTDPTSPAVAGSPGAAAGRDDKGIDSDSDSDGDSDGGRRCLGLLAQVPGLAVPEGLARVNGRWQVYHRALTLFTAHHRHDAQRVQQLAAVADLGGLQQLAHALAGAAATLGAAPLRHAAQALEGWLAQPQAPAPTPAGPDTTPGATGGRLADQISPLVDALNQLVPALGAALAATAPAGANADAPAWPAPTSAPATAEALALLLARLRALQPLLKSHDTAAVAQLEADAPMLARHLGPLADTLWQQVQNFSFGEAQQTLALALQQAEAQAQARAEQAGPAPG